ncbi:hypothetical protein D3C76_1594040 [compost metagenome]
MPVTIVTAVSSGSVDSDCPMNEAGGIPAMPFAPPVRPGVSKITTCNASFRMKVKKMK